MKKESKKKADQPKKSNVQIEEIPKEKSSKIDKSENEPERTITESSKNSKSTSKAAKTASKPKKKVTEDEKKKEEQYRKLEDYINNSGLSLAFNIIFAELISKQILPENFFSYTSMRLKQIGKEIEGLKTKVPMYIEKKSSNKNDEEEFMNTENLEDDNVFLTAQQKKNQMNKGDELKGKKKIK